MKKSLKLISAALAATISMSIAPVALANPPKSGQSVQNSQENSVIKISSLEDLNHLRDLANSGENFEGKTIILENDIYITKDQTKNGDPVEFKPMFEYMNNGDENFDENVGFKGTFDGNGKTLHFNATNSNIFGRIGQGGIVKNLNITGKFEGDLDDGIVAMYSYGTIDNVKMDIVAKCTTSSVRGIRIHNGQCGVIKNCRVKGELSTNDMDCTGICGLNYGTIESCTFLGRLTNCCEKLDQDGFMLPETGGITTFNLGFVKNCHVEADLINKYDGEFIGCAGGIVSTNNGLIENSTFKGSVLAQFAGGLTGSNYGIVRFCKSEAKVEGPCAAEFSSLNMWGDCEEKDGKYIYSYDIYKLIENQSQGVIDSCEFNGSVSNPNPKKIAAFHNSLNKIKLTPKIKNCKINGKDVFRETDNYYRVGEKPLHI